MWYWQYLCPTVTYSYTRDSLPEVSTTTWLWSEWQSTLTGTKFLRCHQFVFLNPIKTLPESNAGSRDGARMPSGQRENFKQFYKRWMFQLLIQAFARKPWKEKDWEEGEKTLVLMKQVINGWIIADFVSTLGGYVQEARQGRMHVQETEEVPWFVPVLTHSGCLSLGWSAGGWAVARRVSRGSTATLPHMFTGSEKPSVYCDNSKSILSPSTHHILIE